MTEPDIRDWLTTRADPVAPLAALVAFGAFVFAAGVTALGILMEVLR